MLQHDPQFLRCRVSGLEVATDGWVSPPVLDVVLFAPGKRLRWRAARHHPMMEVDWQPPKPLTACRAASSRQAPKPADPTP